MTASLPDGHALALLQRRLETILPAEYQATYETLAPVPMKSAGLVYGDDGRVAWDRIWESFCDLAMAGGPPHKGALLEPGTPDEIAADPGRYDEVVEEIGRGVWLAAALEARPSPRPGWVRVHCFGETMADWLLRAIVMENVAVAPRGRGDRPAGVAALPAREGDQERRHGDRQDVPLLDGPPAARPAARDRRSVRADGRRRAAGRAGAGRRRGGRRAWPTRWSAGHRTGPRRPALRRVGRLRVSQRRGGDLDDAGAGGEQRPGAA